MKNLRSMLPNEIEDILAGLGEPKYRAKQVFKWLGRGIGSIDEMSDIPNHCARSLKPNIPFTSLRCSANRSQK